MSSQMMSPGALQTTTPALSKTGNEVLRHPESVSPRRPHPLLRNSLEGTRLRLNSRVCCVHQPREELLLLVVGQLPAVGQRGVRLSVGRTLERHRTLGML